MPLALEQVWQLISEFLLDVVRWPVWWYSGGLRLVGGWCWRSFGETRWRLGIALFTRHLFTPMYGDYTREGRVISVFIRLFILLAKLVRWILAALWYAGLMLAYLLLPPLILTALLS